MAIAPLAAELPVPVFEFLERKVSVRGATHWRWKYGRPDRAFYHQSGDGGVAGFIGLMPTTLYDQGRVLRATWFCDWATGEGSVGVGLGLLRHAQKTTDLLLTLNGSLETRALLPKLRWQAIETAGVWVRPVSARALAARAAKRSHALLRRPAELALRLGERYFGVARPPAGAFTLEEVARFPESYDLVWQTRRDEFRPLMDRSSAQLNFMCVDFPEGGYRRFLLRDGGEVCGHLVLRTDLRRGQLRGRIIDLLWPRGRAGLPGWLVQEAAWLLRAAGADVLECTASVPDLERALAAARFVRRRPVVVWYNQLPEGVKPPDAWIMTFVDCDRGYR